MLYFQCLAQKEVVVVAVSLAQGTRLGRTLCFALAVSLLPCSRRLTASLQPPEFQVICLNAGIILASGRITAVSEATCLLQTIFFDVFVKGATEKKDKQRRSSFNIAGLGLTEKENLNNTVLPERRMSSKIPVFQTRLF